MSSQWDEQNAEPSLNEVLEDPIVRLLMQGDRTGESEVRQLIERIRISLVHSGDDGPSAKPARKARPKKTTRAA
jgi:hypothetical protein